jgi:hypothetical protein
MSSRIGSRPTALTSSRLRSRAPTLLLRHDLLRLAPERCAFLGRESFEILPWWGRIVIHEMSFNDNQSGSFSVAAFNVDMLIAMPGHQSSGRELRPLLRDTGFRKIELKRTVGYWSVVSGAKQ